MRVALPMTLAAVLCACDAPTPPASTAAPTTATQPTKPTKPAPEPAKPKTFQVGEFSADAVPEGLVIAGKVTDGARFTDSNGDNVVVLSVTDDTADLHIVHALLAEAGPPKLLAEVKQERGECEFDYSAAFEAPPYITDADGDDIGEATVAFKFACRSDVSPQDFAVILLEGGKESSLRAHELLLLPGDPEPIGGGQAVEKDFPQDSPKVLEQAKRIYRRHVLTRM